MFRPFVTVVRTPGALLPLVASLLGALPIGMLTLAVLLQVRATTGSLAAAGVAGGALSIGNALGLLVQGHCIDRYGRRRVLAAAGVLCPALLVAFVATRPLPAAAALACGAGACLPATTSAMRVLWPRLVSDPALRTAAYTLLATQFQLAMVTGPLLVAALAGAASPALAVLAAAVFASAGGLLFATAPPPPATPPPVKSPNAPPPVKSPNAPPPVKSPDAPPPVKSPDAPPPTAGSSTARPAAGPATPPTALSPRTPPPTAGFGTAPPVPSPSAASPVSGASSPPPGQGVGMAARGGRVGVGALMVAGFGGGVAGGLLTVSVPGLSAVLAGPIFAVLAAGELLGGILYGGRHWRLPTARRLVVGQVTMAVGLVGLALVAGSVGGMLVVAFVVGGCTAPVSIAASALLDELVVAGALARAYTMLVAFGLVGVAMGTAAGGGLGARPALVLAGGVLGVVAGWTAVRVRPREHGF